MSYIIVALGNPGEEYANIRHNTGRIVLNEILKKDKVVLSVDKKYQSLAAKNEGILFLEPETFMNKSGNALKTIVWNPKKAAQLIVVHDELDLGIGSFKISFNRSAGGHRGVESIVKAIKTEGFTRIRIGISPVTASGKVKKPVGGAAVEKAILSDFKPVELKTIKSLSKDVREALDLIMDGKSNVAMSMFNGR